MTGRHPGVVLVAMLALGDTSAATAGELDLGLGIDGSTSAWQGDQIGGAGLEIGWAFSRWLQVSFLGRASYASIDERMLTYLSVGAEVHRDLGRVRPFLRGGLVHQHEEPVLAYEHQPFQSILGVGDGIRHRAGLDLMTGLEVPFYTLETGDLYASAQVLATWLPDPRGPGWYLSAGLGVGMRLDLDRGRHE